MTRKTDAIFTAVSEAGGVTLPIANEESIDPISVHTEHRGITVYGASGGPYQLPPGGTVVFMPVRTGKDSWVWKIDLHSPAEQPKGKT